MFNKQAVFITSAVSLDSCPPAELPEICFAGRSNVGKSSLINALVNRKNLARTSNVPGKTQQMNYYALPDELFLVDLPGYGFAKVPKKERERWGRSIRKYLLERETLRLVIHVVDARHEPTQLDEDFFYWMASNGLPFIVVLSKADKLSANKRAQALSGTRKVLKEMNIEVPVMPTSAGGDVGVEALKTLIEEFTQT